MELETIQNYSIVKSIETNNSKCVSEYISNKK